MAGPPTHSLVNALRSVPDFAALDDRTLLRLVGASMNLFWASGSTVFHRGMPSEELYIVLSGRVRIFEPSGDGEVEIAVIGQGESFGELSLLLETVHSKTARALEDSELMVVPRDSFEEVLASNPEIAAEFQKRIEERREVRGEVPDSA